MKRIKCYGQAKSRLIETSATKRFFGDLSKTSSNSSQDKSFQATIYEADNLKRSSKKKLSESRVICDNSSSDDCDISANWRTEYIKFKYNKCNNRNYGDGKSATQKKYCEIGKKNKKNFKNITSMPASNRVSLRLDFNETYNNEAAISVESSNEKFNRKKIGTCKLNQKNSKNITSMPASNKRVSLRLDFNKKCNNEAAVSVESSNEKFGTCKLNQKNSKNITSMPASNKRVSLRLDLNEKCNNEAAVSVESSNEKFNQKKTRISKQNQKNSKNITSTPASNKRVSLNFYFNQKCNNEAAVSVKNKYTKTNKKNTNKKCNQKKIGDSTPKNLSVKSYSVSSDDTGFCLMDDGSVHHLMKPSINIMPLTKRTLRYNLTLSSNKRNKIDRKEQAGKKLKLHNSTQHSVNIEDPSNEPEIVLNEDVHKYATLNSTTCNVRDNEDNSLVLNEDIHKNVTLNSITCNVSDKEDDSLKEMMKSKLQSFDSGHLQDEFDSSADTNMKETKTCSLSDQDNSMREAKMCKLSDQDYNNMKETKKNSKLQSSDEHFINFENDCALPLLNLEEIKKEVDADLVVATESEEVPAILMNVIDGVFRSSTIKLQKRFLKNQEAVLHSDLAAPFENKKVQNSRTIIQAILKLTSHEKIIDFSEAYDWSCYEAKRMGDSSCAELFKLTAEQSSIVLKIIVVESKQVNLMNLLAEVKIFKCLNKLRHDSQSYCRNFSQVKRVLMVRGEFPLILKEAWEADLSESYAFNPSHCNATQMYLIFEMDYEGISLSKYMPKTQKEALSIILQLGLALAVAEEALLFEHRDLHSDNVLVKKTDKSEAYFRLKGVPIVVNNLGWEISIIDFSLSKIVLNDTTYFHDLRFSDELFEQQGHAQYEVYRTMKKELKNQWDQTLLRTNMFWITLIGKELFRELEKLGLGEKSPALQKYIKVTERSLSAQEFVGHCIDSTNELYDTIFKPKRSLEPPECIWLD